MVEVGTENLLDVLTNDSDADGDSLVLESIYFSSLLGTVEVTDNSLLYLALQPAVDTFHYIVCDNNAPSLCDTGMVVVEVLDIQIPDSFSPNGDGWNELFQIQGLEAYPGFEFSIFNRWGKRIYSTISADFSWRGEVTEGDLLPTGEAVEGTYFYVLQLKNGFPPLSGTIVLKR
jgi:gliding motility-associated-like protein